MFHFKQFSVCQDGSAMKVGTDGVLLGAWCGLDPTLRRVLDVGTGTGLIALMIAQRSAGLGTKIDALEIDAQSADQAYENFVQSPWSDRLCLINSSLQQFAVGFQSPVYEHIVSNPPYFSASLHAPDERRTVARHAVELNYRQLVERSVMLLARGGRLSVILPTDDTAQIIEIAMTQRLFVTRRTDVFPTDRSAVAKRTMLEFTHVQRGDIPSVENSQLIIEQGGRHMYSAEYRELTRDFYLKF